LWASNMTAESIKKIQITKRRKRITKVTTSPTPKQQLIIDTKQTQPDLTTREIAAIADTDHSHVVKTLQRYGIDGTELISFKDNKADILSGLQHRIASSVTDEDIKKSPLGSRILAMAQLIDKEQLLRGLATSNLAVIHADIAALRAVGNSK
jgi:hypothetical protein